MMVLREASSRWVFFSVWIVGFAAMDLSLARSRSLALLLEISLLEPLFGGYAGREI